jgi:hypothetical protein
VSPSDETSSSREGQDADITSGHHIQNDASLTNVFHNLQLHPDIELNLLPMESSQPSAIENEQLLSSAISDLSATSPQATRASTVSANSVSYHRQNDENARTKPTGASQVPVLPEYTPWGIHWYLPAFIITMLLCGLAFALSHHFYYVSMNSETAGDAAKQAWPIRFGTAFAFLVVSCLRAATASALAQHTWTVVRRKHLKICKSANSENSCNRALAS